MIWVDDPEFIKRWLILKTQSEKEFRDTDFVAQDKFVNDPSRFVAAQCSRRAGKTNGLGLRFMKTLENHPGCFCPYIALTRESARNIMWPVLQEIDEKFKVGLVFTESNLTVTHPNGARLQLFGADMKNFIRRLKGTKTPGAAIDECFHPDTRILTPTGYRRIASLQVNDEIINAFGVSKITKVKAKYIAKGRTLVYGPRKVICSDNHPFFTMRGWVEASELRIGDKLVTPEFSMWLLQQDLSKAERWSHLPFLQSELLREKRSQEPQVYRCEKEPQSYVQSSYKRQGVSNFKENRSQANKKRRQWVRSNRAGANSFELLSKIKMESCNWIRISWKWISEQLQSGLSRFGIKNSNRDRWQFTQLEIKTSPGYQERPKIEYLRLVSNEIYKQTSKGRARDGSSNNPTYFYDLSIEGHPSYVAHGAIVHNCQDFGPHLESLIDDVLTPTLTDYKDSWLALTGTPGPVPMGYFFNVTAQAKYGFSLHKWTLIDNPYLPNAQEFLNEIKAKRQWDENNPTLRREWYNEWVLDVESLLIRYDAAKSHYEELPPGRWVYILGIDIGFNDADALAVLAWSESSPNIYLVEEVVTAGQDITTLSTQVDALMHKYDISKIVMDEGGLGKKVAEEIRRRKQLPIHPADKARKMENVAFLNDYLRLGKFKAKSESRFAKESYLLQIDWDKTTPDRIKVKDSFHSDIIDAVLYAFKESPAFTFQKAAAKPEYKSKDWAQQEVSHMEESAITHFEELARQTEGDGWGW